jgi:rhomboid protease GluP
MIGSTAEPPSFELHFKPPVFWSGATRSWLIGLAAAVAAAAVVLYAGRPSDSSNLRPVLMVLGAGLLAILVIAALRARARPTAVPPLRAYATHLEVPRDAASARTERVEYADILSLNVAGQEPRAILFLGTARQLFNYPLRAFVDPNAYERLMAEVRYRLSQQPRGEELLMQLDRRQALGRAASASKAVVTRVLLICVALGFIITDPSNTAEQPLALLQYGANAPVLVKAGQWYRLFAANFLHANLLHVYMNGVGLLVLGSLLERLLGPWRLLLIYLGSALAGSVASALSARAAFSVGASTAIFGLLGAMAVINWRFRTELPGGFRQPLRWWIFILGLNGLLPLLLPQIDVAAHAGGFAMGVLIAHLTCQTLDSIQPGRATPPPIKLAASLVGFVFCVALGQAVAHSLKPPEADQLAISETIVNDSGADPAILNAIAWQYAVAASPSREELELATRAAESASTLEPDAMEILDTLATVYYRQGSTDRAIELERRVLGSSANDFTITQVARFLDTRLERRGPLQIGEGAEAEAVSLELPAPEAATRGEAILRVGKAYPDGAEIWVLGGSGVFIIRLGPTREASELRFTPDGADAVPDQPQRWRTALVDTTTCAGCSPGSVRGQYQRRNEAAMALPRATRR